MLKSRLKDHFVRPLQPTSITKVIIDADKIAVYLADGRIVHTPLDWFPILSMASPIQREQFRISPRGVHWDSLDEDIPIETFLDDYR